MEDKSLDAEFHVVLLDNGSVSPESVVQARELASALSIRIGRQVDLASVSHSDRIPAEAIGGTLAVVWKDYLESCEESGIRCLAVLPLFFGPSYGLRKARKIVKERPVGLAPLRIEWAPCLVSKSCEVLPEAMAKSAIRVLGTEIFESAGSESGSLPSVLLVDHGSPFPEVIECRDYMARALADRLSGRVGEVIACSMERRQGDRYDFNEPLLERALEELPNSGDGAVVLSQLFLFPGRHAGADGDIEGICQASSWVKSGGRIVRTELLGLDPRMVDLLEARWKTVSEQGRAASPRLQ